MDVFLTENHNDSSQGNVIRWDFKYGDLEGLVTTV